MVWQALRILGLLGVGLLCGCARPEQALVARPTPEELPSFPRLQRTLPARIAAEGDSTVTRAPIVPPKEYFQLSDEERQALGQEPESPPADPLAFYRPPRGAAQGVLPVEEGFRAGIEGWGGGTVGQGEARTGPGTEGTAGHYYGISVEARSGAAASRLRELGWMIGPSWPVFIGINSPRTPAARNPSPDD